MKVIIALDSFKDCLGSVEAGAAVRRGIISLRPDAEAVVMPMADGGEGTMSVLKHYLGGRIENVAVHDALMRPVMASLLFAEDGKCAVAELAQAAGITRLARGERNVMQTTSYGFGELIAAAISRGATDMLCTLGGSATNDAGIGALQALGLRVYTDSGLLDRPVAGADLGLIVGFDRSELDRTCKGVTVRFLYDADIDFTGPKGAVMMYASQKGASRNDLRDLEKGMNNISALIAPGHSSGLGAAGGAGGGLTAFLGAKGEAGIDVVLDAADFEKHLQDADLVITGEGKADAQTIQGKAAKGVLVRAMKAGVPVALLAGRIEDRELLCSEGYSSIVNINENLSYDESLLDPLDPSVAADRLGRAARRLMSSLKN